ncbi:hypothetical protein GON09_005593 [Rhodococcus sp. B50]|nr:hypothetical protein [Rhodococcus sp. B50]
MVTIGVVANADLTAVTNSRLPTKLVGLSGKFRS